MLRRVGIDGNIAEKNRTAVDGTGAQVRIADAGFPVPFAHSLEFNAPVHGTWNIVHIGMLVPECHQIYVCADNCMRGVVLTAAEMDAADRFSSVLIEEDDLYDENLETITIEGVTDAINRLPYRPRAVALFLVCLHHFVGTDAAYVFRTLEERFPHIDFMRCWMDPVMQKTGLTPEQKLKEAMFRPVRPLPADPRLICVLGDNQPLDPDSDLAALAREHGCRILQLHAGNLAYKGTRSADSTDSLSGRSRNGESLSRAEDIPTEVIQAEDMPAEKMTDTVFGCKTYDDYLQIGAASLFITRSPAGIHGVTQLAKRLGRPFLYLPPASGAEEILEERRQLEEALRQIRQGASNTESFHDAPEKGSGVLKTDKFESGTSGSNAFENAVNTSAAFEEGKQRAETALAHAYALIGDTEITLDHIVTPRPLSLARLLLEHGFHVTRVYLDAILPEEEKDFRWLQDHHPDLCLSATIHPKMRVLHEAENAGSMLALGPKAAWFGGTAHFVNLVECGGQWGLSGIEKLAGLMEDAFLHEKDTRALVPRKGFGCACVL